MAHCLPHLRHRLSKEEKTCNAAAHGRISALALCVVLLRMGAQLCAIQHFSAHENGPDVTRHCCLPQLCLSLCRQPERHVHPELPTRRRNHGAHPARLSAAQQHPNGHQPPFQPASASQNHAPFPAQQQGGRNWQHGAILLRIHHQRKLRRRNATFFYTFYILSRHASRLASHWRTWRV